jgi:hypothetical protein
MSFIGTTQTGPGADTYRFQSPGIIPVGASAVINTGTMVRRNVTAVQGQNPGVYNWTPTVPGVCGGDMVTLPTSANGGPVYGVYSGSTVANTSTGAVATSVVTALMTRAGITPTLVGAASGGIAVTVGCQVGLSSLISGGLGVLANNIGAPVNFAQALTGPASQGLIGTVVGYPIATALVSAVTAGTSVASPVYNTAGLQIGSTAQPALTINPGAPNAEVVTFSSVGPGVAAQLNLTFGGTSAGSPSTVLVFGNASTGAIPQVPGGIFAVSLAMTTGNTAAAAATQFTSFFNAQTAALGVAPTNILGVQGIQPFGIATAATSVVSITAAIASPLYSVVPVSILAAGASSFASGGTSWGATSAGAYPTTFGTFINNHLANEPVIGVQTTYGASICPVPGQPGGANVALAQVDLEYLI